MGHIRRSDTLTARPLRTDRSLTFAPLRVRSFRFPWPADPLTSWAFEMETPIPRHVHGDDRERPVVLGGRAPPRVVSYFGSIVTSGFSPLST
jgi:hypothetical protein